MLTVTEVAQRLHVSNETVRRWLRRKELRGIQLPKGGDWRIDEADLAAFIRERANKPSNH